MKYIKLLLLSLSFAATFTACDMTDFGDINKDPNEPSEANTGMLFTYACTYVKYFSMNSNYYYPWMPDNEKKYLVTDNVRLQQVVNNLINNAAKFTTYGSITFGYEEDEDPEYTRIFVEDTGVGISEEGIRHIFERFYKVDNFTQGAGLGLSICQTIVERLRGTIFVTSEVGRGTRFTVRIPNFCE